MTARRDFVAGMKTMAPVLPGIVPFTLIFRGRRRRRGTVPAAGRRDVGGAVRGYLTARRHRTHRAAHARRPRRADRGGDQPPGGDVQRLDGAALPVPSGLAGAAVLSYFLTDHVYALAITEAEAEGSSVSLRWYYLGLGVAIWVAFQAGTVAGVVLGATVPDSLGLEFVIPSPSSRYWSRAERPNERPRRSRRRRRGRRRGGPPDEPRPLRRDPARRAPRRRADGGGRRVTPASGWLIWLVIVVGGLATFALRASFIFLFGQFDDVIARLEPVLRFVPAAVLAALVAPSFVVRTPPSARRWGTSGCWRASARSSSPGSARICWRLSSPGWPSSGRCDFWGSRAEATAFFATETVENPLPAV